MQIYKYWVRGNGNALGNHGTINTRCLGYSNDSLEDALRVAQKRAGDAARRIAAGNMPSGGYYPDSPIREEIVEEFFDGESEDTETIAAITRNSYGCLVLNCPQVFFADVDIKEYGNGNQSQKPSGMLDAIQRLFGKSKEPKGGLGIFDQVNKATQQPEGIRLAQNLQGIADEDSSLKMRLYRTMMGFRVMIVSKLIPATASDSNELLVKMGADKLYASLCRTQDCYRARLTPKAWRIGYQKPSVRFPFETEASMQQFQSWLSKYEDQAKKYSTCHLIGEFGNGRSHPVAEKIAKLHDYYSVNGTKQLA